MTPPLTLAHSQARAEESPVNPFPDNSSENSPDTLTLLAPWDIPITCEPKSPEKQQIEQSLRSLLTILQTLTLKATNLKQAQTQLTQTQQALPAANTYPAQLTPTKTALTPTAITDYDTYFQTPHVQTPTDTDTALCLTHSLLTNCRKFITLCLTTPALNPQHIHQQKQGFITHIHLLTRTFNLPELS